MRDEEKGVEEKAGTEAGPARPGGAAAMDRRHALKVMAVAAAGPGLLGCEPSGQDALDPAAGTGTGPGAGAAAAVPTPESNTLARGTPTDPDLINPVVPWERVLIEDELETLAALCDVIIPEDGRSPSASTVGAHEFIDEWVSAPYSGNERDRVLVRGGLVWLDHEARRRFGPDARFRELSDTRKREICDDICYGPDAEPQFRHASRFFDKVRDLTAVGFYTTDEGMADIGYVGNRPLSSWEPPPPEALRHVGLEP